jgi:hypothetical protein
MQTEASAQPNSRTDKSIIHNELLGNISVAGGCLCGAVRYSIVWAKGSSWPPRVSVEQMPKLRLRFLSYTRIDSLLERLFSGENVTNRSAQAITCQCTQCRKNMGALIVHMLTVEREQVTWKDPDGMIKKFQCNHSPI